MKYHRIFSLLMFPALAVVWLIPKSHGGEQSDPGFDGTGAPEPPMQKQQWTPAPTKLAPVVVDAIGKLFRQGLADPRGCEYREIEITDGWGGSRKYHGWVLPGDGKTRYAIGWNGVVYPVKSVGAPADLRKDFPPSDHGGGRFRGYGVGWPMSDAGSLVPTLALQIRTAFLLRLGEVELAERLWSDGYADAKEMAHKDPYVDMADVWLGRLYLRIVETYLRGDFALATQMSRALLPLQKTVEETAARRGIPKASPGKLYIEELRQLPEVAAESERRAKEPPFTPVLKLEIPEGPARIAGLIHDLELVKGEQMMNPGETQLTGDPVVQALIKEGDPAVEPLIDCLEKDMRLTPTLYTFNLGGVGPIVPVYEPAYLILTTILKTTMTIPLPAGKNPRELDLEDRKALAAKFRDYWLKHKAMSPPERWFSVLQDDSASPGEWLQAARNIAEPVNSTYTGPNLFSGGSWSIGGSPAGAPPVPLRGEPLRSKSDPSVSDLFIKRFSQLLPGSGENNEVTFAALGNLLCNLADWDGKARTDDLRNLTRQFNAKFPNASEAFNSTMKINGELYEKRLAAGDPTALPEYADWVQTLTPESCRYEPQVLRIMWEHPGDPVILKTAAKMFQGSNAPWHPDARHGLVRFLNTPMLGLPVFREQVRHALDDTRVIGYTRRYKINDNGPSIHMNDEDPEDARPDAPPKVNFRMCDYYASQLSAAETFPTCILDWPQEKRDAAVAASKAMLKQYGDAYQYNLLDANFRFDQFTDPAQPAFPRLDHPAAPQDVAQGRAIFSLPGKTRVVPVPQYPLYADRPSSKQDPQQGFTESPGGESKTETLYTTNGTVWQAEEVLVDGKWQRYYGFSGRHQLEKVAASEIEFPARYSSVPIAPFFEGSMEGPQTKQLGDNAYTATHVTNLDSPLVVTMKARNHNGLERRLPGAYILPANSEKALPEGISLNLSYSEKIPPDALKPLPAPSPDFGFFGSGRYDYGEWHEIPLRKEITIATTNTPEPLIEAAGELTLLKMELRDYFDITRPGSYRLQATFQAPGQPATKTEESIFTLVKKPN